MDLCSISPVLQNKIIEIFLSGFVTLVITLTTASYVFKRNRKKEATRDLINDFFSHETLERRLNLHHVIIKAKFDKETKTDFSQFVKVLEENRVDTSTHPRQDQLPRYLDPDFVHVSQFFERIVVFFEQKIVEESVAWASLGRHIRWWYTEFYSKINYDYEVDPRYSNSIEIGQRLRKIINKHGSGAGTTRYLRLQNSRYEPSLKRQDTAN